MYPNPGGELLPAVNGEPTGPPENVPGATGPADW